MPEVFGNGLFEKPQQMKKTFPGMKDSGFSFKKITRTDHNVSKSICLFFLYLLVEHRVSIKASGLHFFFIYPREKTSK